MKEFILSKSGAQKIRQSTYSLSTSDVEDSINSTTPGQWAKFINSKSNQVFIGFINKLCQDKNKIINICDEVNSFSNELEFIKSKIENALNYRRKFIKGSARLFYGQSDGLPGLIVDEYVNMVLIQINTAGIDQFREQIKEFYKEFTNKETFLLDNKSYRSIEGLPEFEADILPDMIEIEENEIQYELSSQSLQKIGYYYDHRINRKKMEGWVSSLPDKSGKGVDLFSYIGSWGMHLAKSGVTEVDFVDQGNFEKEILQGISKNKYHGNFKFIRQDVFKFLDDCIKNNIKYKFICCDPPAFTKTAKQKINAIRGYEKLHQKVLELATYDSIVAFGSCTKYVDPLEFQKTITNSAQKLGRKISLLDIGTQSPDHKNSGLKDNSNYIKFFLYHVE